MILQHQTTEYLTQYHKKQILSQIPANYTHENVMLNISLKLDLSKIFMTHRQLAIQIISHLPTFQTCCKCSIQGFIQQRGQIKPECGIHLVLKITNCPIPILNIKSAEFQLMGFQQKQGIMIYLKDLLVLQVNQQNMYLSSANQIWSSRCMCKGENTLYRRNISKSLLKIIQQNVQNQDKLKSITQQPYKCDNCQKNYSYLGRQNQIYLNCQKIKFSLPKRQDKQSVFQNKQFVAYGQLNICSKNDNKNGQIKPGSIISCCAYIFYKPVITKTIVKQPIGVKSQYSAFLVNVQVHSDQQNSLTIRPQNSDFFYEISKIGLNQRYCKNLQDASNLLYNYQKLVESIDKFKFAYLPPSMLTTLKLSLLNSICNHHVNKNLHICLTTQDIQLALKVMYITGLDIKRWPSEYDTASLINWLKFCRGSIVIVVCPTKKDLQFLQQYFSNKMHGFQKISITFWLVCQANPKKQINIDYFGIVLDLTTEKNINVCKQAIQQCIDLKLSAFVIQQYQSFPITITKPKNIKARIQLIENNHHYHGLISEAEQQQQQQQSKKILQLYYLKCRDVRKTSAVTLSYLYQLAKGFSYLRSALSNSNWILNQPLISILDSLMAIFLDQQSSRNKFSSSNTIFGTQISKLILNEKQFEISFWDYMSQEDGTITEYKNFMSKGQMFSKMVRKLQDLLFQNKYENQLITDLIDI